MSAVNVFTCAVQLLSGSTGVTPAVNDNSNNLATTQYVDRIGVTGLANPTASAGLTAINGSATTAMRSDGAPAIDQTIAPTWTGFHSFSGGMGLPSVSKTLNYTATANDQIIYYTAIAAARTVTLPAVANKGQVIYIVDNSWSASSTLTLLVKSGAGGTINGTTATLTAVNTPYGTARLVCLSAPGTWSMDTGLQASGVGTGSTYTKVTVNSQGVVTAGATAAASDLSNGTTGTGAVVLANAPTFTAAVTITGPNATIGDGVTAGITWIVNGGVGNRGLRFQTGGSDRWLLYCNSTAESGSNVGSDFVLIARTDAGATLGTWITVTRSNGNVVLGGTQDATSTSTASFVTSGGIACAKKAYFGDQIVGTGLCLAVVNKSGAYTATSKDYTIRCDASGGAFTITTPASPVTGTVLVIKKIDSSANAVTVSGTVDGVASRTLTTQYSSYRIQYNGTNWDLI